MIENSLKPLNTFGIQAVAKRVIKATSPEGLLAAWRTAQDNNEPVLVLGEGSNVLFLEDFAGTVILNRIMGAEFTEQPDSWLLHVGAGENWHHLVERTLSQGIPGLENLAMIPGCAGSSPIQNIGAYGVELKDVCHYVDCLELNTGQRVRLPATACQFGYRDSIFKHAFQDKYVIIAIGLLLNKHWTPVLSYGDLVRLDKSSVTPSQVFDTVCHMRQTKLPDPRIQGNAGSFFKNPVISQEQAEELQAQYPNMPRYAQPGGTVKLAAGWLIDQCALKGHRIGGAAVHQQQALVLINEDAATSQDIVALAHYVRDCVSKKFNVWLEPEVRFISRHGEVSAVEAIA